MLVRTVSHRIPSTFCSVLGPRLERMPQVSAEATGRGTREDEWLFDARHDRITVGASTARATVRIVRHLLNDSFRKDSEIKGGRKKYKPDCHC